MDKVRLAVAGVGVIGKRHISSIAASGGAELVGIVDMALEAEAVAAAAGVPLFNNMPSMLDTVAPEGVIVSTPTIHHLQPVLQALDAGAHVLVEKPITATLDEAEQIIAKSETVNRHVLVGHQRRYYGLVLKAREIVQGGGLGHFLSVNGQWTVKKDDDYYDADWRKERAAGPVLTNLIHEIDYLRYICGEITSISAETSNGVMGYEKEDVAACVIRFENGGLGTFLLSDQSPSPWGWELGTGENLALPPTGLNCCRFMGTEAALEFPNLILWRHKDGPMSWNHRIDSEPIPLPFEDAYVAQCQHFNAVIRGDETPRINARDGANTLRATLAVLESAATGLRVLLQ